jgi:hypothetical protein
MVCKQANGDCDVDDTCDGSSQTCAEKFRPTTYVCNSKNDDCGDQQTCTGSSASCPPRPVRPNTHVCRPAVGTGCDIPDRCDGAIYTCPDVKQSRGFVCRANVTDCDEAETCDGFSVNCPTDNNRPRNYVCRSSKGLCDPEEVCDGSAAACGPDVLHPRGYVCRDKAGPCDVADQCPGGDSQCPPDAKEVINTPCNPSKGICDVPELCDGSSNLCPRDEFRPASANFVCRDPNGDCDLRETCDGTGVECPPDKFAVGVLCRAVAPGKTCDVPEMCEAAADCPPDSNTPFSFACDDGSDLTNDDVCDDAGVCSGKCLEDTSCNDRNKCTTDTCSEETSRCIFTPNVDCVRDQVPTNCSIDSSFRFDFLTQPHAASDSADVCLFVVKLRPINGTAIVRNDGESFGVVPVDDDGSGVRDAKIRPNTAVMFEFPPPWTAAIESLTLSGVKNDTLLAVVHGDPVLQRASIDEAAGTFVESHGMRSVTNGVWIVNKSGVQLAPPAIAMASTSSWAVVHVRGAPFSLDGARITRPVGPGNVSWIAVKGGTTAALETTTSSVVALEIQSQVDVVLIGAIVGGVAGGMLLLCGAFAAGVWWTRRSAVNTNRVGPSSTEMRASPDVHNQPHQQQSFNHTDYKSVSGVMMAGANTSPQLQPSHYLTMALSPTAAGYQAVPPTGYDQLQLEFQSARGPTYDELVLRPKTTYANVSAFAQ